MSTERRPFTAYVRLIFVSSITCRISFGTRDNRTSPPSRTRPTRSNNSIWPFSALGLILVNLGEFTSALKYLEKAIALYDPEKHRLVRLAEAHGKVGQVKEGLALLVEALAQVHKTGERDYEAELYRVKGTLTLESKVQGPKSKVQEAEECFHKAIDIARQQSTKSWELRASTSLARLWQSQGKRKEAHKLLAEIYGWFTEGFDTKDLQEAKALLEELDSFKA